MSGGERPSPPSCRSRSVVAGGSLSREVPGWVGAALTKPGRASTARWCGFGERDGEEYARNQRCTSLKGSPAPIWWIWAGCGAHPSGFGSAGNFWAGMWMSVWEATVKCCGVAVAMPQGQSWAPPSSSESSVNTGTVSASALPPRYQRGGLGLGPPSTDRVGTGRSRRSTPSRGEPAHMGKGGSGFEKGWRL